MVATSGSDSLSKPPSLTGEDNFPTWKNDMKYFLKSRGLFKYIEDPEGSKFEIPTKGDVEKLSRKELRTLKREMEKFESDKSKLWYYFRQALNPSYLSILELVPEGDAKAAWDKVFERFGEANTLPNASQLLTKWENLALDVSDPKKSLVDAFNSLSAEIEITYSRLISFNVLAVSPPMKLHRLTHAMKPEPILNEWCQSTLVHETGLSYDAGHRRILARVRQLEMDRKASADAPTTSKKKAPAESAESVANMVKDAVEKTFKRSFKKFNKKRSAGKSSSGDDKGKSSRKRRSDSNHGNGGGKKAKTDDSSSGHSEVTCHHCGKKGHIRPDCPERKPKENSTNATFVSDNQRVLDNFEFIDDVDINAPHNSFHAGSLAAVSPESILAILADDAQEFNGSRCYSACASVSVGRRREVDRDDDMFDLSNDDAVTACCQDFSNMVTTTAAVVNHASAGSKIMVMDSGSNRTHVIDEDDLTEYKSSKSSVTVANGVKVESAGVGKLGALEATHTESFASNLVSIGQLADAGFETTFTKTHALVVDVKTQKTVCRGKRIEGGLYYIGTDQIAALPGSLPAGGGNQSLVASTRPRKGVDAWHSRTHLSDATIVKASRMVDGLNLKKGDFYANPSVCPTCVQCKITRRPFRKDSHRPTPSALFSLVSSDLSGPITPVGWGGERYMIIFVCERSRYKYLFFMSSKDEALEKFKVFKSQCVEAYGFKLSEVLTDGGGEYEGEFDDFCIDNSIVHSTTSPHTPEENSTVEVYWRSLMGMVRTFLKNSALPASMWPWAAKHANYILNRMLPVTIGGVTMTAYQWRFNMRPNLKHLRVWGCECFYKLHGHLRKLDDKGRAGFYIGIDNSSRSAIIYDSELKKIVKSGHVVFNEVIAKRMEVDSGEDYETIKAASLQRGVGSETVIEDVVDFDFDDKDRGDDGLFRTTVGRPARFTLADEEDSGRFTGDARFYDEEPDEGYWSNPDSKVSRTASGRVVTRPSSYLASAEDTSDTANGLFTPSTYSEAIACADGVQWKRSADEELHALESNFTWSASALPKGKKALKSKWVFKIKTDENGQPVRLKSRLTIKGYVQKHGVDYWETYSPVAKLISLRLFFAIAAQFQMNLFQMDVNNAFLNADLKEDIYMELPEGFDLDAHLESLPSDHELRKLSRSQIVLKLNKSLYGLKQAPREWYLNVSKFLKSIGYEQLSGDACIFVRRRNGHFSMLALYVDDLVIACTCAADLRSDVKLFNEKYKMKNIGKPELIVGLNVSRDLSAGTIKLSQFKYVHELLKRFRMEDAKVVSTAADYNVKLTKDFCPKSDEEKLKMEKYPYRELVGCLNYLAVGTRPDISFAVSELSKYLSNPGLAHWTGALHVLRYLKGTPDLGITYRRVANNPVELKAYSHFNYTGPSVRSVVRLVGYSDADWGGDKDTRRSHTGGILFLAGGPIAWISKKQNSVAMSSAESEYMAASLVCREVVWIRSLLAGLGFKQPGATVIHEDNSACIQMSKNPVLHSKTKHIDLHYHFVRERVESGEVRLDWLPTDKMLADLLTKALAPKLFTDLRDAMFGVK